MGVSEAAYVSHLMMTIASGEVSCRVQVGESARIYRGVRPPTTEPSSRCPPLARARPSPLTRAHPATSQEGEVRSENLLTPVDVSGVRICQQVSRALLLP